MELVWSHDNIPSGQLVKLAQEQLGWKKSTTYTVIRKLAEKGFLENKNTIVQALIPKEQLQKAESDAFIETAFQGSLPRFLATFLGGKQLQKEVAKELKQIIDNSTKED